MSEVEPLFRGIKQSFSVFSVICGGKYSFLVYILVHGLLNVLLLH
jgi:hypothetical protein